MNDPLTQSAKNDGNQSSAHGNQSRKTYSIFAKLSLALVAVVLTLILAELTVRVAGLAPKLRSILASDVSSPYKYSDNPILGYEHKANYRNDEPDHVISFGSTNSHGQRDIERQMTKPAGVRRILLLGDSVVESLEVVELDDLMNRQMEMLYSDGKTEVLNFGVNGYCTLAEVELLRTKGLKFDPDLVVMVFVANDFSNFNAAAGGTVAGIDRVSQDSIAAKRSDTFKLFYKNSHLFRLAVPCAPPVDPLAQNHVALGDNNVVQGLEILRKLADEKKFGVILAVWPAFLNNDISDSLQIPGSNDLLIERLARAHGIPTVRLSPRFREHRKSVDGASNPRMYYTIGDGMHVNKAGSRVAAAVLKSVVDEADDLLRQHLVKSTGNVSDDELIAAARQLGAHSDTYNLVAAVIDLGRAQQADGRYEKAIHFYQLALKMDPESAAAHTCLGQLYLEMAKPAQAEFHFNQARP